MSNSTDDPRNTLIKETPVEGTPPDVGDSDGYVDCSLYLDDRMPIHNLKTISGKVRAFNQMQTNSTVSGILLAFRSLCQTPKLTIVENSDDPDRARAEKRAQFLKEALGDMQTPFSDVIGEVLDMIAMGFKVMVPQFKARTGYDIDHSFNSRYSDGKIGWKSFLPIKPETITKWNSPQGSGYLGLTGITQTREYDRQEIQIPRSRMLLFRTCSSNNDPTGKSILEGAYLDWVDLVDANKIQMVGLKRSIEGVAYGLIHSKIVKDAKNSPAAASAVAAVKRTVRNLDARKDSAFILPADRDTEGNLLAEVRIMGAAEGGGNSKIQDTKVVIDQKEQSMSRSMLAQFMTIQGKGGSYALSKNQSEVFINSLRSLMIQIEGIMNGEAIPKLFAANKEGISKGDHYLPSISFSEFVKDDVTEFFTALQKAIEMGLFEVTPQVQTKAAQVLGVDNSGQKELLAARIKAKADLDKAMKKTTELAEQEGTDADKDSSDTDADDAGGQGDVPDTKLSDIKDDKLKTILTE